MFQEVALSVLSAKSELYATYFDRLSFFSSCVTTSWVFQLLQGAGPVLDHYKDPVFFRSQGLSLLVESAKVNLTFFAGAIYVLPLGGSEKVVKA